MILRNKILISVIFSIFLVNVVSFVNADEAVAATDQFEIKEGCTVYKDFVVPGNIYSGQAGASDQTVTRGVSGTNTIGPINKEGVNYGTHAWGILCLVNSVYRITDMIFFVLFAISVVLVAIGAFFYTTAAGDTEKISKGKNFILYAMIGIVIAIFSKAIPAIVKFIVF